MKRLSLFCALAGLFLGTASLPRTPVPDPPVQLLYAPIDCTPSVAYSCAPVVGAAAAAKVLPSKPLAMTPSSSDEGALVEPPPDVGVRVVVSLPLQTVYVFDDGELVATSPISTGKRGHRTPVGTFPILQKKVRHRSSTYDNAPMPYMQRLTWRGIALHAGELPGYPASHGCIRLPWSFAKKLYGLTDYDTKVTITDKEPESPEAALDLV